MKAIYPLSPYLIFAITSSFFAVTSGAQADSTAQSSWLLSKFTQNAPCKGDGSDPAELKMHIATDQIESKSPRNARIAPLSAAIAGWATTVNATND